MKLPDFDWQFFAVVIGGAIIKVATSHKLTTSGAIVTAFIAIFCAMVFTDPVATYLGLEGSFRYAIAALLTFTGEGLVRALIRIDRDSIIAAIRAWRGK